MTTLAKALQVATAYWDTKGASSRMLPIRAKACMEAAGLEGSLRLDDLGQSTGTTILTALYGRKLSKSSVGAYYAAFKRMLSLSGVSTGHWPKADAPPRRVRDPLPEEALAAVMGKLEGKGWTETSDLLLILNGTGMRVDVEALSWDAWEVREDDTVRITGKGGHERVIPVTAMTGKTLRDKDAMAAMRVLSYGAHLARFNKAVRGLGVESRLPTFHAIRHLYATRAYAKSGRNLMAVKELLGHADIKTTARYVGVSVEDLRSAI